MKPRVEPSIPGGPRRLEAFAADPLPGETAIPTADWRAMLDSIHDGVLVQDSTTGRTLHANAAACRMYGYDLPSLLARSLHDLSAGTPPHDEPGARQWLARAGRDGPQVFEWLARRADGSVFWVEVAIRVVPEEGRSYATVRDISRRKALAAEQERAVEALRESEERLRLLLGRMPGVAIQGCGPDGTVRYWNHASEELYGYSAAEAIGRRLVALIVPPPLRDEMQFTLHQILVTGQSLPPGELQLQRKDGTRVPVFSSHCVLQIPGAGPELYRLDFDLRERKQAESERLELERKLLHGRKLESLGALAGGVAHDFNNLLTGVLGNLELVRSEVPLSDSRRAPIDDAIEAARRAARLTHQMLAYAGRTPFHLQRLDLSAVVRDQEALLHAALTGRANLEFDLAADLPEIEADPSQLLQAVINLVTNAAESIGVEPGTIELRTYPVSDCTEERLAASLVAEKIAPQEFVALEVADTGRGMDTATAHRVFDPFFSTKFAGRGLGLPVVLGIVRAHRGALFIDSLPGQGCVVTILLPVARGHGVPPPGDSAAGRPRPLRGLLLVVDDEEAVRRIAQRMAQRLGLEVLTANDGETAVELCRAHAGSIGCALIDLTMPGMDGAECLRALRELCPGLAAVLTSGCAEVEIANRCQAAGFSGFLAKPFSFEQFASAVATLAAARPRGLADDGV